MVATAHHIFPVDVLGESFVGYHRCEQKCYSELHRVFHRLFVGGARGRAGARLLELHTGQLGRVLF